MACFGKKFSAPTMASRISHFILSLILTPDSSYRAGKSRSSLKLFKMKNLVFRFLLRRYNIKSSMIIPEIDTTCSFILITLLVSTDTAATVKWADKRRIIICRPSLNWELQWWQRRRSHRVAKTEEAMYGKLKGHKHDWVVLLKKLGYFKFVYKMKKYITQV